MFMLPYIYMLLLASSHLTSALVTLKSIKQITNTTDECTNDIKSTYTRTTNSHDTARGGLGSTDQVLLGGSVGGIGQDDQDDEETEDVVAAALRTLDRKVLEVLNVPLDKEIEPNPRPLCPTIVSDHHSFLSSIALFLRAVEDVQQRHNWDGESPVFQALAYLQALWASRKVNEQARSFIEQQMQLYSSTGCFGDSNEVLRRNVEVVEYMNDLIDTFGR